MSRPMPTMRALQGFYRPWPMEGEILDVAVTGEIPKELHGSYYRNGPNRRYAPRNKHNVLSETLCLALGDGRVDPTVGFSRWSGAGRSAPLRACEKTWIGSRRG